MTKHASSSRSQQKTLDKEIPTSKEALSTPAKRQLDAWVEANATELLRAITNWKRTERAPDVRPGTATHYNAREGTEKDLRHNLGLIYKEYGPLHMHYKGCDNLARHWVTGWHVDLELTPVQKVIMCVHMKELLPGQSPVLEKLAPHRVVQTRVTHADSDEDEDYVKSEEESEEPDEDHEVWSGEEITENEEVWSVEESEEEDGGKQHDNSDWVDVPSGGGDDGDQTRPNDLPFVV